MAVKVKATDRAAEKWQRKAGAAGVDYAEGVTTTAPGDWENAAKAAEPTWGQAVTQAIAARRYGKGLSGKGSKWQSRAIELGQSRFAPGVAAAAGDYATNVAPYLQTIAGLTLPQKGPKGDPRNYGRVQAIGEALRKRKMG